MPGVTVFCEAQIVKIWDERLDVLIAPQMSSVGTPGRDDYAGTFSNP